MSYVRYEKYKHARTLGEYLELGAKIADAFFDNERGFLEFKLTPEEQKKKDEEEARIRALIEKEERRVQEEKENWLMAEEERMSREFEAKMKVNSAADIVSKENQKVVEMQEETIPLVVPDRIPCRSRVVGPGRAKIAMQVIPYVELCVTFLSFFHPNYTNIMLTSSLEKKKKINIRIYKLDYMTKTQVR